MRGNSRGALAVCTRLVLQFHMEGLSFEDRRTRVKVEYDFALVATPGMTVRFDTAMIKRHNIWASYDRGQQVGDAGLVRERVRRETLEYIDTLKQSGYTAVDDLVQHADADAGAAAGPGPGVEMAAGAGAGGALETASVPSPGPSPGPSPASASELRLGLATAPGVENSRGVGLGLGLGRELGLRLGR